jgi:hypothetical protein
MKIKSRRLPTKLTQQEKETDRLKLEGEDPREWNSGWDSSDELDSSIVSDLETLSTSAGSFASSVWLASLYTQSVH